MTEFKIKSGLAQMLKGGVIMDVMNVEQAIIAQNAGACAVMALEKIPSELRKFNKVARMSDPKMIKDIMEAVSIPVMAKCRIGHIVEAEVLQSIGVDYIDESEVLTPADRVYHTPKSDFKVPFVCGAKNLGEALRRINEGAAMLRTKGEAGTGDISEAVKHLRQLQEEINYVLSLKTDDEIEQFAKSERIPIDLLKQLINDNGKLPVVNFAAGGVATPSDAALCMRLGAEGVFVGSGIFTSKHPEKLAKAIVDSVTNFNDSHKIMEYSTDLGELMPGISVASIQDNERLSSRGW